MKTKKEKIEIRVTKKEKEYIKSKTQKLGFNTMSAFLINSAESSFRIEMDMSVYRELSREVNYIGKNINSLIRRINTDGIYTDSDIDFLKTNQEKIIELLNKEHDHLLNMRKKYTSDNMTIRDKKKLIEYLKKNEMIIPKKFLLEDIYESIKDDFIYINEQIEKSPEQEEELVEYVWEYLYEEVIKILDENELNKFANEIYLYTQKLKFKLAKLDNYFDDEDWYELKDILDDYEV